MPGCRKPAEQPLRSAEPCGATTAFSRLDYTGDRIDIRIRYYRCEDHQVKAECLSPSRALVRRP